MYYRTIWNIDLTKTHVLNLWRNAPRLTCRFGFISLTPLRKRNKIRTECPCWLSLKNLPHVMEMCSAVRGFSNGCCLVGFLLLNCLLFTLRVWQIKIFSFQKLIGISYLLLYKKTTPKHNDLQEWPFYLLIVLYGSHLGWAQLGGSSVSVT